MQESMQKGVPPNFQALEVNNIAYAESRGSSLTIWIV